MKTTDAQLTDAMICRIVDAHSYGVDFASAVDAARVPEHLAAEAKEFWNTLDGTALFAESLLPRPDIIARILEADVAAVPERAIPLTRLAARPSPYVKYLAALSVPMAILVLIIGVSLRPKSSPNDEAPTPAAFSAVPEVQPAAAPVQRAAPLAKIAPEVAAKRSFAPAAKSIVSAKIAAAKKDPKRLFAMLSNAGTQETKPDTVIDDAYDARLQDLSAKVIAPDPSSVIVTNPQNNATLQ